jgi:anti-sigma factor RsiW
MLTCRELRELVTDRLEGHLSLGEKLTFELHLVSCVRCRAHVAQMRSTVRLLSSMPPPPMSKGRSDAPPARPKKPPAGPIAVRLLSGLDRALGGKRGFFLSALFVIALVAWLGLSDLRSGPMADGVHCALLETTAGGAFIASVLLVAILNRARLSAATWTAIVSAGALAGFAISHATCPMARLAPHVIAFHIGGYALTAIVGLTVARLPSIGVQAKSRSS